MNEQPISKKTIIGIIMASLLIFVLILAGIKSKNNIPVDTNNDYAKAAISINESTNEKPKWEYSETTDNMDNQKSFFARINSENSVDFKPPYDGGSTFNCVLQKQKKDECSIYFEVSKGQFMTGIENEKTVRIKFDNEQPFAVHISGTSDLRSNVVFLHSERNLISKMKTSKKMIIEAEFFEEGKVQAKFNISGLNWTYE